MYPLLSVTDDTPVVNDRGYSISTGSLISLVTITVDMPLATECLNTSGVEALNKGSGGTNSTFCSVRNFHILVCVELCECSQRYWFVLFDIRLKPHVDFSVRGLPLGVDTGGNFFLREVSCC
ncbi:MAG: hypothetical protein J07HN4v3_01852 [Halonotius sp. J07HN4]|nr:MAG: hypothetical protein J07HN4v3_01852 [Halonotius sp. J07HN4]